MIPEGFVICEECTQKIYSAYAVKSAYIRNEDLIGSYKTNNPGSDKLIDVYIDKNNIKSDFLPRDLNICRFCITMVPDSNFSLLEDVEIDIELIKTHLPEVVI